MKTSDDKIYLAAEAREMLYGKTQRCIIDFENDIPVADANRLLDAMVMQDPLLHLLVERAQGRWLYREEMLAFIPLDIGTHTSLPPEQDEEGSWPALSHERIAWSEIQC